MLADTDTLGSFSQQTLHHRPAVAPSPFSARGLLIEGGLLALGQPELTSSALDRLRPPKSLWVLEENEAFMPEFDYDLSRLAVDLHELRRRRPPSVLAEEYIVSRARPVPPKLELDAQPFVMAVRELIESERLTAARRMLDAAPAYIRSDPLVAPLRAVLAPPVVRRVQKRDVDRREEYEWLHTNGRHYRGRWVAIVGRELIASAPTLHALQTQLALMALPRTPLLHRVN